MGKKRTISPEHLAKMQAGRENAAAERARTAERTAMLAELDERLEAGRREAQTSVREFRPPRRRRRTGRQ